MVLSRGSHYSKKNVIQRTTSSLKLVFHKTTWILSLNTTTTAEQTPYSKYFETIWVSTCSWRQISTQEVWHCKCKFDITHKKMVCSVSNYYRNSGFRLRKNKRCCADVTRNNVKWENTSNTAKYKMLMYTCHLNITNT